MGLRWPLTRPELKVVSTLLGAAFVALRRSGGLCGAEVWMIDLGLFVVAVFLAVFVTMALLIIWSGR